MEVDCLEQPLLAPAKTLLEDQQRHRQSNRRIRSTMLFIEQLAKALFADARGNLNVVPCIRVIGVLLVAPAPELFDVADQIDLAAVRTGSEHSLGCSDGNSLGFALWYQDYHSVCRSRGTLSKKRRDYASIDYFSATMAKPFPGQFVLAKR
jgi:hypothetical protein